MEPILRLVDQCSEFIASNLSLCVLILWSLIVSVAATILWYKNRNKKCNIFVLQDYCDETEASVSELEGYIEGLHNELAVVKNQRDCAQGKFSATDKRAFCIEQAVIAYSVNVSVSVKEHYKDIMSCFSGR